MASGGHLLAQQKHSVEARIKGLLNADLKEICKAYGAAVSGTKVILQKRCIQGEWMAMRARSGAEPGVGVGVGKREGGTTSSLLLALSSLNFRDRLQ